MGGWSCAGYVKLLGEFSKKHLSEASEEGNDCKRAVVPLVVMNNIDRLLSSNNNRIKNLLVIWY